MGLCICPPPPCCPSKGNSSLGSQLLSQASPPRLSPSPQGYCRDREGGDKGASLVWPSGAPRWFTLRMAAEVRCSSLPSGLPWSPVRQLWAASRPHCIKAVPWVGGEVTRSAQQTPLSQATPAGSTRVRKADRGRGQAPAPHGPSIHASPASGRRTHGPAGRRLSQARSAAFLSRGHHFTERRQP